MSNVFLFPYHQKEDTFKSFYLSLKIEREQYRKQKINILFIKKLKKKKKKKN
jgi:hypothetical protein